MGDMDYSYAERYNRDVVGDLQERMYLYNLPADITFTLTAEQTLTVDDEEIDNTPNGVLDTFTDFLANGSVIAGSIVEVTAHLPYEEVQQAQTTNEAPDDVETAFTGTLVEDDIQPGTVDQVVVTLLGEGAPEEIDLVDNGAGVLSGVFVGGGGGAVAGTIVYATGAFTLTFDVALATGSGFDMSYKYYPDAPEVLAVTDDGLGSLSAFWDINGEMSGTIDYDTGEWALDFTANGDPPKDGSVITMDYQHSGNARNLALQIVDYGDADLQSQYLLECFVCDDVDGETVTADAPDSLAIGTDGDIVAVHAAEEHFTLLTDAEGKADITITKAGAKNYWISVVLPTGRYVVGPMVAFAAP